MLIGFSRNPQQGSLDGSISPDTSPFEALAAVYSESTVVWILLRSDVCVLGQTRLNSATPQFHWVH